MQNSFSMPRKLNASVGLANIDNEVSDLVDVRKIKVRNFLAGR